MLRNRFYILVLAIWLCMGNMFASVKIGDLFYELDDATQTASVASCTDHSYYKLTSVTIPSSINYNDVTYTVTSIDGWIFGDNCLELESVYLPNSLIRIGEYAFSFCRSLTNVDIPNSVTEIGQYAFGEVPNVTYSGSATGAPWGAHCLNGYVEGRLVYKDESKTDLLICSYAETGDVVIPEGVVSIADWAFYACRIASVSIPSSVTSIGESAFESCRDMTRLTINNSAASIGNRAFLWCTQLTEATLGANITSIGEGAFSECYLLTGIVIPNSVTTIGKWAFWMCYAMTSVTLSNAITRIEEKTFAQCSKLENIVIPYGVTYIGEYAFSECENLTHIEFSGSVTTIDENAFYNCPALTEVVLPNSVTSIGLSAFEDCKALKNISLGSNLTIIGDGAFMYCPNVTTIINQVVTPQEITYFTFAHVNKSTCVLYVPKESIDLYKAAEVWKDFLQIEEIPVSKVSEDISIDARNIRKQISNGHVFIESADKTYTISGQQMK